MLKQTIFFLSLMIIVSVTGCNLPNSPEISPDFIESQVSNLLTTTPAVNEPIEIPTEVPTITVQFTPETIIPSETLTPTQEPSLTPTILPQGIPTGSPTWIDTFVDGTRFGLNAEGYDDGQTKIIVSDGSLTMTSISAIGWRGWRLTSQKPANYYLQANFQTNECAGSDQYGLVVQSPDFDSGFGYYFGLTCDGRYAFQKWEDSGLSNLQGWTNDQNIVAGANQNNTIGILKSGNQYNLYINNISIGKIDDEKFSSPGYFGLYIAGVNTPNFSFQLNEISYWDLP
jgi:hypothetical protein